MWRRLKVARDQELMVNLETRKGRPGRYRAVSYSIEAEQMLPSPEELEVFVPVSPPGSLQPCNHATTIKKLLCSKTLTVAQTVTAVL